MNCDHARKLLPLFAGRDLDAKDSRVVEEHVALCPECRALSEELSGSLAWLRSAGAPPVSETDYAEMRRGVWRQVGKRGPTSPFRFLQPRKAALAAAFVFAAILAAFLVVRRAPREKGNSIVVSTSVASNTPMPAAVSPEPPELSVPRVEAPPAPHVAANLPARVRRQRPVRGEPSGVDRIEFRTANPNVRIIWLVRKGGERSSSLPAGRNQEVS